MIMMVLPRLLWDPSSQDADQTIDKRRALVSKIRCCSFFSPLSSAVHRFSLRSFSPLISLFIPNSLPGFFPCLFSQIHKPQQFQIPWLCSFSKPHLKNKLITPPTHEITLRKRKSKRKYIFYLFFSPFLY